MNSALRRLRRRRARAGRRTGRPRHEPLTELTAAAATADDQVLDVRRDSRSRLLATLSTGLELALLQDETRQPKGKLPGVSLLDEAVVAGIVDRASAMEPRQSRPNDVGCCCSRIAEARADLGEDAVVMLRGRQRRRRSARGAGRTLRAACRARRGGIRRSV